MPRKEWAPLTRVVETPEGIGHTLPEGPVARACDLPPSTWEAEPARTHAAEPQQRAIETLNTADNRIDLGRNDDLRIYVIRFRNDPDAGRPDDRRPVFDLLKASGFHYRPIPGAGMAWQKPYGSGAFSIRDEMAARQVARDAAKLMGSQVGREALL